MTAATEVEDISPQDIRRATLLAIDDVRGDVDGLNHHLAAIAANGRLIETYLALLDIFTAQLAPMVSAEDLEVLLLRSLDKVIPPHPDRP